MAAQLSPGQLVESHKFWEVAALWAAERLHLLAVVRQAAVPAREVLTAEFVRREDFRAWLDATRQPLPSFWFTGDERERRA